LAADPLDDDDDNERASASTAERPTADMGDGYADDPWEPFNSSIVRSRCFKESKNERADHDLIHHQNERTDSISRSYLAANRLNLLRDRSSCYNHIT
jgi:hypothetical protein